MAFVLPGVSFSPVPLALRCLPAPGVPLLRTVVGVDERVLLTAMRSFFLAAGLDAGSAWTLIARLVASPSILVGGSILETLFSLFLAPAEVMGFSILLESTWGQLYYIHWVEPIGMSQLTCM